MTINQKGNLSPYTISKIGEAGFIINSGRVFSMFNPLDYTKTRFTRDGDYLVDINKNSAVDQMFTFTANGYQIDIYVWATLKVPDYWITGRSFIPKIDRSWIVLARTNNLGEVSYQTDLYGDFDYINNIDGKSIFMDSDRKAANLMQIGRFVKSSTSGLWELVQTWNDNIFINFLIDWQTFFAYTYAEHDLGLDSATSIEQTRLILDGINTNSSLSQISNVSVINRGNFFGHNRSLSFQHYENNFAVEPIL